MKTISMKISDNSVNKLLPIVGAKFESNNCYQSRNCSIDFFKRKLMTSPGPYISDYVTHQNDFKYNTLGIHVGQIDRLTFMGGDGRTIIGHLIDCRKGSPTYGIRLRIEYNASMGRKLIIPMGVAHSFENLQNVVTLDEPIWYSSFYNKDWDISNDLISIPLDVSYEDLPEIQVNQFRLPVKAHIFFSQLQQENLKNAKAYADRFKNEYGQYQLQTEEWSELPMDFTSSYDSLLKIDGVKWLKNSYALTGPRSFTIVPSSKSCVSDVVELDFSGDTHAFRCHKRQNSLFTFLDREGRKCSSNLLI